MPKMEHVSVPLGADDDVDGFNLGDMVTVTITGKIDRMEAERTMDFGPDDEETYPPEIGIKVSSVKVKGKTQIERMVEDEDDD